MERFVLKFLWLEKSVAVCLDQKVLDRMTPLTEYYFWPQNDAWEEMKVFLESKVWITDNESIFLLNQITEVINDWQAKDAIQRKDTTKLREKFPNAVFIGFN